MLKKVKTILFLIVAILFLSAISVSAKEMDINELGEKALNLKPGINYIYVIGEHAFTSSHILTTQDVMLAAKTIKTQNEYDGKNEEQALNEMSIQMITSTKKIENGKVVVTGWNKGKDILGGTTTLNDKVNIKYIDYNYIPEDTEASMSLDLKDSKYTSALSGLGFAEGNDKNSENLTLDANGNLTGLVLKNTDVKAYPEQYLTGYYFAYTLKVKGADDKTTVKINHKALNLQKELTYSNFDIKVEGDAEDEMVVLVALNDKAKPEEKVIEIVVDRDGDGTKYNPKTITINYKDLTYQQDSKAQIKSDSLPEADVTSIATSWGYTKTIQDTYELKVDDKDSLKFNLSGMIVKQSINDAAGLGAEGYFVLYNINDSEFISNKTTIVVPVQEGSGTDTKTIGNDGNGLTILHKLNDKAESKEFKIVVDIDGAENNYAPVTYTINYSDVVFGEPSKMSVVPENNALEVSEIKTTLQNKFNWTKPDNWNVTFNAEKGEDETVLKLSTSGMLPIMENITGFSGDAKTNYYLPVVIKSSVEPKDETKLIIPSVSSENGTKEVIGRSAWDKIGGEDNEIVILMSLKPEEVQAMALDTPARTFDIIIDLDGDDNTEYLPYTITVDYTNLKFQQKSKVSIELGNQTETDEQFKNWGYEPTLNNDLKLENGLLSGTLVKQQLESDDAFGEQNKEGYYFEFKIDIPEGVDCNKVTIDRLDGKDGSIKKNFPSSDFADKGYLTILFRFEPDKVKCDKCNSSPAQCNCSTAEECSCEDYKLYYRVDFDGKDGDEYLPQDYVIDYCKIAFESDVIIVRTEEELNRALESEAEHILIGGSFEVTSTVNIERSVVISGNNKYTITAGSDVEKIFTIKSQNVTIDDITLANAKTPIVVETGSLTTTGLTVEGENVESAVEVKNGATLTISKLTFNGEKYDKPSVKAEKINATVNFTDSTSNTATKLETVEKITTYEQQKESSSIKNTIGDYKETDSSYQYYNYYNKAENGKIYKTTFHNHEGRTFATFERYNYYGEQVTQPDEEDFSVFTSFNYDGETYTLIGYAENRDYTVNFNYSDELPQGVVTKESIKATADKYYYAAYSVKLKNGVKKVKNTDELKKAITEEEEISEIYIDMDPSQVIDLSNEDITINRKLSIIGPSRHIKIKVKGITVTANDVFLHRLDFEFTPDSGKEALISTTGSKLTLWQCTLKNNGTPVNDAIKYSGTEKATVDVRWNTIYADNIKNTLLNIDSGLAAVTDIYGNTFKKLNQESNSKKSAITIKTFDESATMKDDDETIRIAANTFDSENYAIEISKEASGKKADISLELSKDINVAVRYDESNKNFGEIKLHHLEDEKKINITYIDQDGQTSSTLQGGEEIEVVVPVGMQGIKVPEQAVIKGLKLNGNVYSGIISQSEDGNFYLPVALTSNDFKDKVSTVKVTDPNGNVKTYLYSSNSKDGIATVSNEKTMNLQLEAIKSSRITDNNGKVYKIELDADGDKSDDYKVKEYIINYSGVETLEEKINQAAKATLEANSFTVTKNNKINGYTEKFTYKYNKEQGLTHLKSEKDNVEEYTFSLKYVGVDSSKLSVVASKKIANQEDSGVYLNDWVYVHPQQVGSAIHEVSMLTDIMKDSKTSINAIDKVTLVDKNAHKYKVELNRDKYNDWVKNNYLSNPSYASAEWALKETVIVEVVLDENEQYIKSIKTHQASSNNAFDVTFADVNKTIIEEPTKFLAEKDKTLKDEDIKNFYESGKKWWEKHIYENAYKQQ